MKKYFKKAAALTLSAVMGMSLMACGAGNDGSNVTADSNTQTAANESAATENASTENSSTEAASAADATEAAASEAAATSTEPTAEKDITLVLDWTPNTNHTGFYVALEKGYYDAAGINLKIVQPPEDGATMMVASGQAEFGIDFQDYLAPVFSSGDDYHITTVATLIQHNTSGIISLKEDGINSFKDLEGKNYATWGLPVEQAMMQYCMEAEGGDYSKLNLIPETITDEAAALQQDIDAIWIYYAWAGIATQRAGLDTNTIFFKDIVPEFDYYNPVIVANTDFLDQDPETAKAFLEATKKGYEDAIADPDAAAEILVKNVPELDLDMVKESQEWLADQYKAEVERWGYIDPARWDGFYKWLSDNNLSDPIPAGKGFTNDYLPE